MASAQVQRALFVEAVEHAAAAVGQRVHAAHERRPPARAGRGVRRAGDRRARGGRERARSRRARSRLQPVLLRARRHGPALRLLAR